MHVEDAFLTPIVLGVVTIAMLRVRPLGMLGRVEDDAWLVRVLRRGQQRRGAVS